MRYYIVDNNGTVYADSESMAKIEMVLSEILENMTPAEIEKLEPETITE